MTRFSETYTIKAFADSVRIWIKPSTTPDFPSTPLIESWPGSDPASYSALTANYTFTAGQEYDIRVDYRERTGPAMMRLLWSSPSTPEEVIQPTAIVGEIPPQRSVIFADAVLGATNWGENNPTALRDGVLTVDSNGWPAEDFTFLIRPQDVDLNPGTYLLSFRGQARVRINLTSGSLFYSADGATLFGSSTNGTQGYDVGTNTTTLRVFIPAGNGNCWPTFSETDRDGPGSAFGLYSGVTDIRMFKPVDVAGTTPHNSDELYDRKAINTLETFVTFRWNDVNGNTDAAGNSVGAWSDRRRWGPNVRNISFTGENHEHKILLSNHTGRDLYIQIPHNATDDYVLQLARLIRFGGDANGTPYTSEQANPVFPPLNPNLRVIVEYSNETPWNTAGQYPQGTYMQTMPGVLRAAWLADPNSPDGQRFAAINFDGSMSTNPEVNIDGIANGSRYFALRTVEISNIFRLVFGDDAMPAPGKQDPRVRPVLMYQYDNQNNTATNALNFIDRYFFKTDPLSTFSGTPRPVSWYLFGGGAATYYASADRYGLVADSPLTAQGQGTFETLQLAPGEARVAPTGSNWTFSGPAGIYREAARNPGVLGAIPSTTTSVDAFNYRGMRITVGSQPVAIYEIGRYVHSGNTASQTVAVYDADPPFTTRLSTSWSPSGVTPGQVAWRRTGQNIFFLSNKAYSWPVILQPGKSYYVVALESATGNSHALDVPITPPPGITINGAASGSLVNGTWTWQVGTTANRTHGPLNIKVAPAPHITNTGINLGFLNDSKDGMETITSFENRLFSPQAAFLAGNGSMEIEVTFPAPGTYGLIYHLAHKRDQTPWDSVADIWENRIMVQLIDGGVTRNITPSSQWDTRPSASGWNHETFWAKPNTGFDFFGSAPFEITDASKTYRIRFSGTATTTDRVVLIDNVHIASAAKMTEGQIPSGGGFAEGAPDVSNWEARVMSMYKYPQSFGLKAVAYEGGWYPGGDANKMPLQYASSYFAPAMFQGEINAISALARAGLAVNSDYTFDFAMPDRGITNPDAYQRILAWKKMNSAIVPEATNGQPLTSIMTSSNAWLSRAVSGATMSPGGWFSWNVIAPASGLYNIRLETTGNGTVSVRVDDATVAVSGAAGGVLTSPSPVFITKGLHTLRVLTQNGTASLVSLTVSTPGQPAGFNGVSASPGNAEAYIRWNAVTGATGYHVYFKNRLDSTFTRFTTAPVTGTELTLTGLQNNTTYQVVVTYLNSSGVESSFSNQVSVVPSESPPLVAWEFSDATNKTSGSIPATLQSTAVSGVPSILNGPARALSPNSFVNLDGLGWGSHGFPTALDPNLYLGFNITPAAGKTLRLTQLNLGLWVNGTGSVLGAELRVSTNNFSTFTTVPLSPAPSTIPPGNLNHNSGRMLTADLSGLSALQNIAEGTTVGFRVYFWGNNSTIYAGLGKIGDTTDDIVLFGYPVDPNATETPVASVPDGIFAAPLSVSLSSATSGAQIRYTTDGTNPTSTTGTLYTGPVVLNSTTNLRAVAYAAGKTVSSVLSRNYTIAGTVAAPEFNPPPGVYDTPQEISLFTFTSRASIRYTTDGSTPTPTFGTLYTGPFTVSAATTVRAIAYRSDLVPSSVSTGSYSFDLNSPGTLSLSQSVATVSETAGSLTVTVRRTGGAAGNATVQYSTASGTAAAGQDFTAVSGTFTWASGDLSNKTVVIPLINDKEVEPNETFTFNLSNATGATLGSPSTMVITLTSDDTAPVILEGLSANVTMSEDGAPTPFTLTLTASEPDGDPLTWTIATAPSNGNASLSGSGMSRSVSYTPNQNFFGADSFVIRIADPYNNQVLFPVNVTIQPVNDTPVLTALLFAPTAWANQSYSWTLPEGAFTDVEDATLTYNATLSSGAALPAWLTFNPSTRTFSGTPGVGDVGSINLRITATDSGGAFAQATTTLVIKLPAIPLFWGGGSGNLTGTSINTNSQTAANMAGVWNAANLNWNESLDATDNYRAWADNNLAYFKLNIASGASANVELASNMFVAGLTAEFTTNATNQAYNLISTTSENRTLTLPSNAEITIRTAATGPSFNIARSGHLSGRGGTILAGTSFTFSALTMNGAVNRTPIFGVASATLRGTATVNSGILTAGSTSVGATGMPDVALFDIRSQNSTLRPLYQAGADNRIGNNATIRLTLGLLSLQTGSPSVAPNETIGSLVLEGGGILSTHLNRPDSTVLGILQVANPLHRGMSAKGVLVTENANNYGGLGVSPGGLRVTGHGIPANTFIPWGFNYGRAQLVGGGQTTNTSAGFMATDSAGELLVRASIAGNADLTNASWQGFTVSSDVTLDTVNLSGALSANVTTRSLAVSVAASGTFGMGGRTLRTGALGFGDNAGRNLTVGTNDASRGVLTAPEGVGELYIFHRRQNPASASALILNSVIAGTQDVIFAGPSGQIQLGGNNTYTGKTFVSCGLLQVNAGASIATTPEINLAPTAQIVSTAANLTIGNGAPQKLTGGGATPVSNNLSAATRTVTIGANGTLAPGNPGANAAFVFAFTTGKLAFATGSKVELDLGTPGASDRIAFSGAAGDYLATTGSPLLVLRLGESFDPAATYTIIENVTTAGFTFAGVSGLPSSLTPTLSKVGNNYVLTFQGSLEPPPATCTVTFDAKGGTTPAPASKVVTVGQPYGALAATTRAGYAFAGWFTAPVGGSLVTTNTTVSVSSNHTLYANWTVASYGAWAAESGLTGPDAAAVADPDGDGVANLLEYALGGDPLAPAGTASPTVGVATVAGQPRLTLSFTPQQIAGLRYVVQASSDLSDWTDQTDLTDLLVPGQPYTFTDPANLATNPRRFLRLRVIQQP